MSIWQFMKSTGEPARALIDSVRRLVISPQGSSGAGTAIFPFFESEVADDIQNNSHAAGTVIVNGTTVPAGKVWYIDAVNCVNTGSGGSSAQLIIVSTGSIQINITNIVAIGTGVFLFPAIAPPFILSAGERMQAIFFTTLLNDALRFRAHGYQASAS